MHNGFLEQCFCLVADRRKIKNSNIENVISEQSLDAAEHSNYSDYFHTFYIGIFYFPVYRLDGNR